MAKLLNRLRDLGTQRWALGFIHGGLDAVMKGSSSIEDCRLKKSFEQELDKKNEDLQVDWVKMPKDRWFADPFILDVTDSEILLLVEDYAYATRKGIISLIHIDRANMEVTARKVLLELPTHLSFPAIWRKDGHIYVYPESANSGKLDMYEYHSDTEELSFVQTICDDVVWDSYITEAFGEPLLFTAASNDYHLDIYKWNRKKNRFVSDIVVPSDKPNSRMGGAVFEYKGACYYPAQDCSRNYGSAIDIKRINYSKNKFELSTVKHLTSTHPNYQLGMHTLNEYKGVVVIDVLGYRYGWIGNAIAKLVNMKKRLKHAE